MWSHLASDSNDFNTNHTSIATQLEIHRIFPSKNHQLFVLSSHVQLSKLFWAIRRGWGWNQTRLLKTRWWIMWIMSIHKWWWYKYTSGWWLKNNLEKNEFVNGKDDIPFLLWKMKNVPNHQSDTVKSSFSATIASPSYSLSISIRKHQTKIHPKIVIFKPQISGFSHKKSPNIQTFRPFSRKIPAFCPLKNQAFRFSTSPPRSCWGFELLPGGRGPSEIPVGFSMDSGDFRCVIWRFVWGLLWEYEYCGFLKWVFGCF